MFYGAFERYDIDLQYSFNTHIETRGPLWRWAARAVVENGDLCNYSVLGLSEYNQALFAHADLVALVVAHGHVVSTSFEGAGLLACNGLPPPSCRAVAGLRSTFVSRG